MTKIGDWFRAKREWAYKKCTWLQKQKRTLVMESIGSIFTIISLVTSFISFAYYIKSTEHVFENGYILKSGYSINNIPDISKYTKFDQSSFNSFTKANTGALRVISIIQFFLARIYYKDFFSLMSLTISNLV